MAETTTVHADVADDPRRTSRRSLLGLGAALAVAAASSEVVLAPAESAVAAPRAPAAHHGRQCASASLAAKKAGAAHSKVFPHDPHAHLLRRATFGPRPSDVADLQRLGIDGWLARQLDPGSSDDPHGERAWKLFPLAGKKPKTVIRKVQQFAWDAVFETAQASLARQVFSDRLLYEVVVDVFANHLHVPLPGEQWQTAPSYLHDVVRAHALGSFETMLLAAAKHPAMLNFLSNDQSLKADVNENYGRELLELHTVGLAAGYTEHEVRSSAAILSGRTWDQRTGTYRFDATQHATGHVRVLGFSHSNRTGEGGEAVGDEYLRYLARHPLTARNIARKLAVRFVSDSPSADLVDRLAHVYLAHGTSIRAVVEAVFRSTDFWASVGTRMRRPLEDAVGALRVLDVKPAKGMKTPIGWLYWNLDQSGQTPHGWMPPNGYPDVAVAWLSAGGMIQRWNLHRAFVYGWWPKLGWTAPSKLVHRTSSMTTIEWTRAVAHHLLGVVPTRRHLVAAIHGSGLTPGSPAPVDDWRCGKVASLLLDSPYFQLR